jgi:hypothetical protein
MVYLEKLGGSRKAILKTGRNIMKSKTVAAYATLSCIDAITIVCRTKDNTMLWPHAWDCTLIKPIQIDEVCLGTIKPENLHARSKKILK